VYVANIDQYKYQYNITGNILTILFRTALFFNKI